MFFLWTKQCRVQWSKYIQSTVGMFTDTWEPVKGREGDNIIITLQWIWHTVLHINVEKKKKNTLSLQFKFNRLNWADYGKRKTSYIKHKIIL